jgi:hypothetical protein
MEYGGQNTGDGSQETEDGMPEIRNRKPAESRVLLSPVFCLLYSVFFIDLYSEKVNLVHHFREHDGP